MTDAIIYGLQQRVSLNVGLGPQLRVYKEVIIEDVCHYIKASFKKAME